MLCVVLRMEATSSPLVSSVVSSWLDGCAAACQLQLTLDVAPFYGGTYAVRNGSDVQPGEMVFAIVDSLPDVPGAIAYHDVTGADVPVAYLALSTCNTLNDVSSAISHELCETAGDPACDLWADDGTHEWARELCDAVESNFYLVNGFAMSDFLLPGFFASNDPGPYSFCQANPSASNVMGICKGPFQLAGGGYQIQRTSGTNEAQVTGKVRKLRAEKVAHWSSRVARRGVWK